MFFLNKKIKTQGLDADNDATKDSGGHSMNRKPDTKKTT